MLTQTTAVEVTVFRTGITYWHGVWHNGTQIKQQQINANRARQIIDLNPSGTTETGQQPDFAHSPCYWQWRSEVTV